MISEEWECPEAKRSTQIHDTRRAMFGDVDFAAGSAREASCMNQSFRTFKDYRRRSINPASRSYPWLSWTHPFLRLLTPTQLFTGPIRVCFYFENPPAASHFPSAIPSRIRAFDFIGKLRPLENFPYRHLSKLIIKRCHVPTCSTVDRRERIR